MAEIKGIFYTVCCFHPDSQKIAFFPLCVLEFTTDPDGAAKFYGIWWPCDDMLRFLESQTNSVFLKTTLLNFAQDILSGMREARDLKHETIFSTLSEIVGCGNFSFTELVKSDTLLDDRRVGRIIQDLQPQVYQLKIFKFIQMLS